MPTKNTVVNIVIFLLRSPPVPGPLLLLTVGCYSSACGFSVALAMSEKVLVGRLVDMGFSRPQAEEALMLSGGDPDQAAVRLMMPQVSRQKR